MNKQLRKPVIAGNWKMNNTPAEATALIEALKPLVKDADCEVVCCVPYIDLYAALEAAKGSNIQIGAENCHWAEKGAFTGEVSAKMLKAAGVPYVIIGHSERRQYFGETDVTVRNRVRAALNEGLKVILCVGEVLSERKDGITSQIVWRADRDRSGAEYPQRSLKNIVIAYEPRLGYRHGRDRNSRAGQRGLRRYPLSYRETLRQGRRGRSCCPVRRLDERQERRGAARSARC